MSRLAWRFLVIALALVPALAAAPARAEEGEETRAKMMQDLKPWIEQEVQRRVKEALEAGSAQPPSEATQAPAGAATPEDLQQLKEKVDQVVEAQKKTLPGEFNPAIGLVGETLFSYRSKGSAKTGGDRPGGFDVFQRSVELDAAASVDPFAKAYVVINGSADAVTGEAALGVEEAALQTTSLPGNLEVKAGRFFAEFGRLAYIHDHELPVVNRPLVLDRYIGGESRTDGLQVNYLLPVPQYVSLTVGAGDQFGGDVAPNSVGDFRHADGLNFWSRLSTYFDLTPDISLEPGVSGLWNPDTKSHGDPFALPDSSQLTERERRLVGVDLVLSWRPLRNNQFRSITWGNEVLFSNNRYDVDTGGPVSKRNVSAMGLYSYLAYKFDRQWTTGLLLDWLQEAQDKHEKTTAYSPFLTWAISHWNQLRLQYTHTDHAGSGLSADDAVYVQWAWIIGSHSHGWQQR